MLAFRAGPARQTVDSHGCHSEDGAYAKPIPPIVQEKGSCSNHCCCRGTCGSGLWIEVEDAGRGNRKCAYGPGKRGAANLRYLFDNQYREANSEKSQRKSGKLAPRIDVEDKLRICTDGEVGRDVCCGR